MLGSYPDYVCMEGSPRDPLGYLGVGGELRGSDTRLTPNPTSKGGNPKKVFLLTFSSFNNPRWGIAYTNKLSCNLNALGFALARAGKLF